MMLPRHCICTVYVKGDIYSSEKLRSVMFQVINVTMVKSTLKASMITNLVADSLFCSGMHSEGSRISLNTHNRVFQYLQVYFLFK